MKGSKTRSKAFLKAKVTLALGLGLFSLGGCGKQLTKFENLVAEKIADAAVKNSLSGSSGAGQGEMTERLMDKIAKEVVTKFMASQEASGPSVNMDEMKSELVKAIARETLNRFLGEKKDKKTAERRVPVPADGRLPARPEWPDYFGWKRSDPVGSANIRVITSAARQTGLSPEEVLLSAISNGSSEAHLRVKRMRLAGATGTKRAELERDVRVLSTLLEMRRKSSKDRAIVNRAVNSAKSRLFVKEKLLRDIKRRLEDAVSRNLHHALTSQN